MTGILATAFGTGLLGSLHCFSMCGPLALAGCGRAEGRGTSLTVGYFGGRLVSYMLLGAVMGNLGQRAMSWAPLPTIQIVAMVSVAAVAAWRGIRILVGVRRRGGRALRDPRASANGATSGAPVGAPVSAPSGAPASAPSGAKSRTPSGVLSWIGSLLPQRGLGLGLATGVLPCGLLVAGWMLAASTADPLSGSLTMAAFAAGSSPGLVVPLIARGMLARRAPRISPTWQGIAWCALAVWVGVRPLWVHLHGCH